MQQTFDSHPHSSVWGFLGQCTWKSGLNVAPENARELAEAIQTLTHDENTYRKYTENAGKRFQNLFTQKKMIDQCLKIYESL